MASLDLLSPANPRPPDPGRNPPSQGGETHSEDNASMPMAPIVSLVSAGKTIALMESIFYTTRIIVDEGGNDEADVQTECHKLTQRLQDLQTLIHRGMGRVPLSSVSNLYDLLESYHCIISTIQSHIHSGPMSMELIDKYTNCIDDFQNEFELQVSIIVDNRSGGDMFTNCNNFAISGGNFVSANVATVTYVHSQPINDKLAYVQIGLIVLFGSAGRM